jgi:hypothetical protein
VFSKIPGEALMLIRSSTLSIASCRLLPPCIAVRRRVCSSLAPLW